METPGPGEWGPGVPIFDMYMGDHPPNFVRPARGKSTWYKLGATGL